MMILPRIGSSITLFVGYDVERESNAKESSIITNHAQGGALILYRKIILNLFIIYGEYDESFIKKI